MEYVSQLENPDWRYIPRIGMSKGAPRSKKADRRFLSPAMAAEVEKAYVLVMLHGYPGLEQNMAMHYEDQPEHFDAMMETAAKGYFCMPHDNYLREGMAVHSKEWRFDASTNKISQNIPLRFNGGVQETIVPPEMHITPRYDRLKERGMDVAYNELNAGHIFTAYRIMLTNMVFDYVAEKE